MTHGLREPAGRAPDCHTTGPPDQLVFCFLLCVLIKGSFFKNENVYIIILEIARPFLKVP